MSREIRDYCLEVWASAAVGLIHAYDPELIVIGGGVMRSGDVILPYIQEFVNRHAWTPWGKVRIAAAELGNHAGLVRCRAVAERRERLMDIDEFAGKWQTFSCYIVLRWSSALYPARSPMFAEWQSIGKLKPLGQKRQRV